MNKQNNLGKQRRRVLKLLGSAIVLTPIASLLSCSKALEPDSSASLLSFRDNWDIEEAKIRSRIITPSFPNTTISIADLGAKTGKDNDATQFIAKGIESLSEQGGGKLLIPAGEYYTGPIHLKSNINLHLEEGAILHFYNEPERYKPYVLTRWEGMELMGYSPLIYAYKQRNIAVTGKGILEGGGNNEHWWPWKGKWKRDDWQISEVENQKHTRNTLMQMVEDGVPVEQRVFEENYLRPPLIQPYACDNVLIEGVEVKNSPFWLINPVLCKNVSVKDVHCESYGPNSDGCNPESCTDVLIENCLFDTGDDCIAIKSGRNADGRRLNTPCSNIIIANCTMKEGHGGVVIGSELSGGVNNLYARDCNMSSPDLERGIRIKTNSIRGGHLYNLNYRDINIGQVKDAVVINYFYEEGDAGTFKPKLENINIDGLQVEQAERAFVLRGFIHTPITGLNLRNITISKSKSSGIIENLATLTQSNIQINGQAFVIKQ